MKTVIAITEGEYWWGGTTITKTCPITQDSDYHQDFHTHCFNQTASCYVSNLGRYIWSDEPFRVDVEKGAFVFEGGEIELTQAGSSLREAYLALQKKHFPPDGRTLQDSFFTSAQYNTWMQFTYYPTQEKVLSYAREIVEHGYEPGILILDEGWHENTGYGRWRFDQGRFPDPKSMVNDLHTLGFKVLLWVVPFVSPVGPDFVRSLRPLVGTDPESSKRLYLRTETGEPALTKWWNGTSCILDMTDEYNQRFLENQLSYLMQEYGIDGFKFDGGTPFHYSDENIVNGKLPDGFSPQDYNRAWNDFGRRFPYHEYKDTYGGGGKNMIQRLHDRDHRWVGNGIDDLLPCAFAAGLIGHPFLCPDMVGGGEWSTRYQPGFQVDEELFVRMAEVSALFPMIQFSWAPWEALSPHGNDICLSMARLHEKLSPLILKAVREAEQTGEPLVRPLEYNDPGRGYVTVGDEFMLGTELLSAPVLTPHTYERKVFFPAGRWTDEEGNVYEGHTEAVLPAPLEKLLWFRRI